MRSATCVIGGALLVLTARPSVAPADDGGPASYRAVIDRVALEPASIGDLRLRVELSALALQGQRLDLTDPRSIRLMVGGGKLEAPFALGTYGATNADTAIVIVIEANLVYAETLPSRAVLRDADGSRLVYTVGGRVKELELATGSTRDLGAGSYAQLEGRRVASAAGRVVSVGVG